MSEGESKSGGEVVQFPGNPGASAPAAEGQPIPDQDREQGSSSDAEKPLKERIAAAREKLEALIEEEDRVLLGQMKAGEVRVMKPEGAARHCVRKVLDAVTGEASIDRFVEYGENPFHVVYFMPEQVVIEAAAVAGGVMVRYNGAMEFIPGASLAPCGLGFVKIVK